MRIQKHFVRTKIPNYCRISEWKRIAGGEMGIEPQIWQHTTAYREKYCMRCLRKQNSAYLPKNLRFRTLEYGLKRLNKIEKQIEKKLTKREHGLNRHQKEHPGEMVHTDSSLLPLLRGEAAVTPREYLYVFADDYSRFLFADILPDQTSWSAAFNCLFELIEKTSC